MTSTAPLPLHPSVDAHFARLGCKPAQDALDNQVAVFKARALAVLAKLRRHIGGASYTTSTTPDFAARYSVSLTSEEAAISADTLLQHAGLLTDTRFTQHGRYWTVEGTACLPARPVLLAAE